MEGYVSPYYHRGGGLPRLRQKLQDHAGDLTVVLWGDSLLAREQHTSAGDIDPRTLPPLMHTRKLDWFLWQCLDYPHPLYRRLDHPGTFSLIGDWAIAESDPGWDDAGYRPGWTALSADAGAVCCCSLPAGREWTAAGLVYRTDTTGALAELAVEGGSGHLEAWDEAEGRWAEAHGYRFSLRQDNSRPRTGNTTYQKRLWLRRVAAVGGEIGLTVRRAAGSDGRLMLWGLEGWEAGQGVLRLINSARGSHTLEMLVRSMENEVRQFQPDLVVLELPLLNMLHQCPQPEHGVRWVWDVVWGDRPGAENDWALLRAEPGRPAPEVLLIIPHHTQVHFTPDDGWAPYGDTNAREYFQAIRELLERREEVPYVDMARAWLDAIDADPSFPSRYQALAASSPTGPTYTNDGVHQNDRGTALYARHLCAVLGNP